MNIFIHVISFVNLEVVFLKINIKINQFFFFKAKVFFSSSYSSLMVITDMKTSKYFGFGSDRHL